MAEIFDLYTVDRQKTGKTMFRGEEVPENHYRLVVHALFFNHEGKLLIQQRQEGKEPFPSLWDISVGGSVQANESSWQAICRECQEELGYTIVSSVQAPKMSFAFKGGYDDVYFLQEEMDITALQLQKEEVQKVCWASKEEVLALWREGKFIPYLESYLHFLFERRHYENNFQ